MLEAQTTGCGVVAGGGVDIVGESTSGGGGGSSGGAPGSASNGNGAGGGEAAEPCVNLLLCTERLTRPEAGGGETATPTVTIRDVARLVPSAGGMGMEPSGWMVVGLPTNFYATAPVEVVGTTVLGRTAEVRFTAVSFEWNYGDGSSLTSSAGGATWASLGLAEFSPTGTSHVYAAPGSYTIELTVSYSAEYRIEGSAWVPLQGTVPSTSPPIMAIAAQGQTVLVPGSCGRIPGSPGC